MKKVICAAAAFMMVAGVATVASAEVKLGGDARARLIYNDNGASSSTDYWDSRVRIKVSASTEGGGYAIGRIRLLDGKWGQGADYTPAAKGSGNVWSDYAYLGFKKGNVDVAAGKMPIGFSAWFLDDERTDRFRVKYTDGGLLLAFTYDKKIYDTTVDDTVEGSTASLDDKDVYGITYKQKFSDAVTASARVVYVSDDTAADLDGVKGSVNLAMNFGGNNIFLEQSYKEGDTVALGSDDQYGGYAEWNATFGSITPVVRVGYTVDGFSADETFGWIMVGGDEPISQIARLGTGGDTYFAGLSSKFQTSEELSLQANLVFLDIDNVEAAFGENPIEVSGQAKYTVVKGVDLVAKAGWLKSDNDSRDDAVAAYGKMEVNF